MEVEDYERFRQQWEPFIDALVRSAVTGATRVQQITEAILGWGHREFRTVPFPDSTEESALRLRIFDAVIEDLDAYLRDRARREKWSELLPLDDLIQETLQDARRQSNRARNWRGYVRTIARRRLYRASRRPIVNDFPGFEDNLIPWGPASASSEILVDACRVVEKLEELCRSANHQIRRACDHFIRHVLEGESVPDIDKTSSVGVATINRDIAWVYTRLRKALEVPSPPMPRRR